MMSCKEVTRLVSESMDRRLTLGEWFSLRVHLTMCKLCHGFAIDMERIREAIRGHAQPDADVQLPPAAKNRIEHALKEL
ncbi:MAG: zf-HC2 domain-containing protein [Planctomycetota bacterium]